MKLGFTSIRCFSIIDASIVSWKDCLSSKVKSLLKYIDSIVFKYSSGISRYMFKISVDNPIFLIFHQMWLFYVIFRFP